MKTFVITAICSLIMLSGCDFTAPQATDSPVTLDPASTAPDSNTDLCRSRMITIATVESMYYGMYNTYTGSFENFISSGIWLYNPEDIVCPECEIQFLLRSLGDSYTIYCPLPTDPTHGSIVDGIVSWLPSSSTESDCRSNMHSIATAEAMYFGIENTYTDSFEDFRTSGIWEYSPEDIICPGCGTEYDLRCPDSNHYTLCCPMPSEPTHGSIVDGITSWE